MAKKTSVVAKKTKVVAKKTAPAPKKVIKAKTVDKKVAVPTKKKPIAVKKVAVPTKKKPIAVKKVTVPTKKKPIAVKKVVIPVKKKPIAVKKVAIPVKKKPIEVKKPLVVAKAKPITGKKPIAVVAKAKPKVEKEDIEAPRKRPGAFYKQIGSAKKRKSRARKALVENKQETDEDLLNKRTSWNKKPTEKKKRLIIEKPTMRVQPESNEPKKVFTGPKKIKYQVEMNIHASPRILYPYLSTSSGLAEWFALKVDDRNDVYTFEWEGSVQVAKLVSAIEYESVRFHWVDDPDDTYFQIELVQDEMTSDVAIIVTDFCLPEEKQENTLLWESQIHDLMHVVGSQF